MLILGQIPIACVDVLPARLGPGGYEVGLIERLDQYGVPRWAMLGGGVYRNEALAHAIDRHVEETLGDRCKVMLTREEGVPHAVGQYFPSPRPGYGHDPRKHAIALSYWAMFSGEATPMNEAESFEWFPISDLPADAEFGYGHELTVARVVASLRAESPRPTIR